MTEVVELHLTVDEASHGMRLDRYLCNRIKRLSRARVQHIIRTQLEGPAGRRWRPSTLVHAGDELIIRRPLPPEPTALPDVGVLYDDEAVVVFDKPAGMAMHPTARYYFSTLTHWIRQAYPDQGIQIAHRLDRETSGCVIAGRGRESAARLKMAFEERRVSKTYLAVVRGAPDWQLDEPQRVDIPLGLAQPHESTLRVRMRPAVGRTDALSAVTVFRLRQRWEGGALLACEPITGRQHQIRVHLEALGFPIAGDKIYGRDDEAFKAYAACGRQGSPEEAVRIFGLARQALHAHEVCFPHPADGRLVTVTSPLPPDLAVLVPSSATTTSQAAVETAIYP